MKNKKSIYVNISIITILCSGQMLYNIFLYDKYIYSIISSFIFLVCLVAAYRLRNIFISREKKITERKKAVLYIFIILNYFTIVGLAFARMYDFYLADYISALLLVLNILLITVYFESIFDEYHRE